MKSEVLRLGHRFFRDARISTHLALTARAFGADKIVYDVNATDVKDSVDAVTESWGGDFKVEFIDNPKKYITDFQGTTCHLTMYGELVNDVLPQVQKADNVLVIVGGNKVPADIYDLVDFNIGCGSQPHSEVAALAVFLDRLYTQKGLLKDFIGGKKIVPQKCGKKIVGFD